ncbi:hypothetical protein IAI10_22490 [Clostridium sp. 19966]|uniref:hypothetical protein n=1 Tax=Clostridium sp. 19966 TaxID=2768166 RepID=UPI0028DE4046|nr:hypothetical protein [Clostridium sp. 19966]MDT8719424.1 hypothetical protein [Clostridium sp. 19966]
MSKYKLQVTGNIQLGDYSDINDYIDIVDAKDEFLLSFDGVDNENVQLICKILKNKNFLIRSEITDKEGKIYIQAEKRS